MARRSRIHGTSSNTISITRRTTPRSSTCCSCCRRCAWSSGTRARGDGQGVVRAGGGAVPGELDRPAGLRGVALFATRTLRPGGRGESRLLRDLRHLGSCGGFVGCWFFLFVVVFFLVLFCL